MGEGGFGAVFEADFQGTKAAFKKVKIELENGKSKEENIRDSYEEFDIQRNLSMKPVRGGRMVNDYGLGKYYKEGDENLILPPIGSFFISDEQTSEMWLVIILPVCKMDLQKMKKTKSLSEENIRDILRQIERTMNYLGFVRGMRHQDLKPNNFLVEFDEDEEGRIENIKFGFIL